MKNKKLYLIASLVLVMSLGGCNSNKNIDEKSSDKEVDNKIEQTLKPESTVTPKPLQSATPTSKPIETPKPVETLKPIETPKPVETPKLSATEKPKAPVSTIKPTPKPTPQSTPTATPTTIPTIIPTIAPTTVPPTKVTLSSKEIYEKISVGIEFPMQIPMEETFFKDTYGIDSEILDDYYIKMPMMNVKASECAIFKVKDIKNIQKVLDGINKRYASLDNTWSQYLPDQYELVKNKKIITKGNYVLFVIDEASDKLVENFNTILK